MGFSVERNNYVSVQALGMALAQDLVANGFTLVAVNGSDVNRTPSSSSTYYVFQPTAAVDPIDQSWRLVLAASDDNGGTMRFWACHETQVNSDSSYTVVNNGASTQSGHMYSGNDVAGAKAYFLARSNAETNWSCFKQNGVDPRAIPLSYLVSISDHGISFFVWAESFDRAGDCFSWFTVQRPVQKDGTVVSTGKSPLFCVFCWSGGGDTDVALSEDLASVGNRIQKFVVYETDVNAPTAPDSACISGPDSRAIINPLQQVALSEDNQFVVYFPQGVNTQRFAYPYELDMVAYTSADVITQDQEVPLTLYGEAQPRVYRGMQANFPKNTGMRMLCLVEGSGIAAS